MTHHRSSPKPKILDHPAHAPTISTHSFPTHRLLHVSPRAYGPMSSVTCCMYTSVGWKPNEFHSHFCYKCHMSPNPSHCMRAPPLSSVLHHAKAQLEIERREGYQPTRRSQIEVSNPPICPSILSICLPFSPPSSDEISDMSCDMDIVCMVYANSRARSG
jgi:hypothetical protein